MPRRRARRPARRHLDRVVVRERTAPARSISATVTLEVRVDGDEVVLDGVKRPVESARRGRPPPRDRPHRTTGSRRCSCPPRRGGRLGRADAHRRSDPPVLDRAVRRRAGAGDRPWSAKSAAPLHRSSASCSSRSSSLDAETVGAMQRAFDMTVEWAFDRYSFGRPLASYQELKHRFADMKIVARSRPRDQRRRGGCGAATRTRRRRARQRRRRPTSATTAPSSCRTACRSTAASA